MSGCSPPPGRESWGSWRWFSGIWGIAVLGKSQQLAKGARITARDPNGLTAQGSSISTRHRGLPKWLAALRCLLFSSREKLPRGSRLDESSSKRNGWHC